MADLFEPVDTDAAPPPPLAEQLRPANLSEVVGQDHLLGEGAPLARMAAEGRIPSLILWGPPGVGKTTLARLLAERAALHFEALSAVFSGVADLRKVFAAAKTRRETGRGTLIFVDEIHRFNRSQQDSFLPFVESGVITLIGATTENPSFELNGALLSRAQVFVLHRLDDAALESLLLRAEQTAGRTLPVTDVARTALRAMADGDGRYLLNLAEELLALPAGTQLDQSALGGLLQKRAPAYDKNRDEHYNLISALHKSVRGSDPDAALYWFARMLAGGEDPLYLGRRLVRMASEDIGLADPLSLMIANEAVQTYRLLGSPEGELALAHAVVHLATAPKSNAVYRAFGEAMKSARKTGSLAPPAHILNAPTTLMKEQGYGAGYQYDHDSPDTFSGQNYFPEGLDRPVFYNPQGIGREKDIRARLERWRLLRKDRGH
ncbi:MAG: replication-associated recombination protein A [Pseudomonadota bacterium]